jgi:hypothetical protein
LQSKQCFRAVHSPRRWPRQWEHFGVQDSTTKRRAHCREGRAFLTPVLSALARRAQVNYAWSDRLHALPQMRTPCRVAQALIALMGVLLFIPSPASPLEVCQAAATQAPNRSPSQNLPAGSFHTRRDPFGPDSCCARSSAARQPWFWLTTGLRCVSKVQT